MVYESFRMKDKSGRDRWLVIEQSKEPDTFTLIIVDEQGTEGRSGYGVSVSKQDWQTLLDKISLFRKEFWAGDKVE